MLKDKLKFDIDSGKYKKGVFPEAEKASREVLSLPIYPELADNEIELIASEIINFFTKMAVFFKF